MRIVRTLPDRQLKPGLPLVIGSWTLYRRWRESPGANLLEGLRVVVLEVSGNSDVKQLEP